MIVMLEHTCRQRMGQPHHHLRSNHGMPLGISHQDHALYPFRADYMKKKHILTRIALQILVIY